MFDRHAESLMDQMTTAEMPANSKMKGEGSSIVRKEGSAFFIFFYVVPSLNGRRQKKLALDRKQMAVCVQERYIVRAIDREREKREDTAQDEWRDRERERRSKG